METSMTINLRCPTAFLPKLILLVLTLSFGNGLYGQSPSRADLSGAKPAESTPSVEAAVFQKSMAIGLNVGTSNAPGLDVAYTFAKHFTARVGFGYLSYGVTDYTYTTTGSVANNNTPTTVNIDAKANLNNLNVLGEYAPGNKGRFRLVAGFAFFTTKNLTLGGDVASSFKFNDVTITPEDIGSGIATIGFASKISPYLGFGFGRAIPRKRLNLSLDLGAYYLGDYRVNIDVKPGVILEGNENNAAVLERNLNEQTGLKFLPNFNLRLAYKLK
jgi:hypothetical protein